ncbi:MAG: hypothetical protein ABI442_05875, partial [Gemmatimonadaceae bacterium]
ALTRDPMVMMSEAETKQLYAFRLDVVKTQRTLREKQAQLDTAQRLYAAAKRAADTSASKMTPELTTQVAAVEKELAEITKEMGTAAGGRGGRGGGAGGPPGGPIANGRNAGAAGAAGAPPANLGRGGRGGGRGGAALASPAGAATGGAPAIGAPSNAVPVGGGTGGNGGTDDAQNPGAPTAPQTIQAKLATTTEMLNVSFNPSPTQKKTIQTIPGELQKQGERVSKVSTDALPALIKSLKAAGIDVKTP